MDRATFAHANKVLWDHLAPVRAHFDNPGVQEIMINSPGDIWVEQGGCMQKLDLQMDTHAVDAVIRVLSNLNNKSDAYILDCRLPGLRVAAARAPVAMRGHSLCIRKHAATKIDLNDYLRTGAFNPLPQERVLGASAMPADIRQNLHQGGRYLADFLRWAVASRKNLLISGSTSSGKTTLVGALLDLIPQEDRLIIIEDTGELSELDFSLPNRVHLEANDTLGVSIRDLVKLALRYRPTRIIIGEIRDRAAYDMVNAYQSGHPGGIVTLHGESAPEGLAALERRYRQADEAKGAELADIRTEIAKTFTYVIQTANTPGVMPARAPIEVIEITGVGADGFYTYNTLYRRFLV